MVKTNAIIRSLGFLDFLSYHQDLTLPASRSSSTCCLFQVVDPFLVGTFLFQQVMPSSSNRKVLWLNFFAAFLKHFCPLFLHNLPRWVFFCPDWVSFCPEYYLQPLFFTQPSHTLFEAPSPPQNTPFPGLNLKVGKMNFQRLQSGQLGPQLGKMFEKWAKLF